MADRNKARRTAYSVLRKHRLTNPSLDDLVKIATVQGYDVIDYSKSATQSSAGTLIRELGLQSFARNGKSFIYRNNDIKLIFLCETMTANEKKYALAHELGHVYCGHLKNGAYNTEADMEEEYEANEFAHYLLHPEWYEKVWIHLCYHKVITIIVVVILLCCLASIFAINLTQSFYGEYYVTEKGEKYHVADCPVIKDKKNAHRLTVKEYESGEYEPCQICLPDDLTKGEAQ